MNRTSGMIVIEMVLPYYFYEELLPSELDILNMIIPEYAIPMPIGLRVATYAVELQIEAGLAIQEGKVEGKNQYTGMTRAKDNAEVLGYNLIYQPGGMKI